MFGQLILSTWTEQVMVTELEDTGLGLGGISSDWSPERWCRLDCWVQINLHKCTGLSRGGIERKQTKAREREGTDLKEMKSAVRSPAAN